ncbi:MAG: hypothetical protein GWP08_20145, partial [Nitrospiraceae bacterium]|nr:hypothetical protein [Nitrospiraceae bacterium]
MSDGMDLDSQDFRDRVALLFRYGQVGRCVSSVTHDVNNVLGAIQAYSELLDLDENLSDESRRMTMQIGEGVAKCSALLGLFLVKVLKYSSGLPAGSELLFSRLQLYYRLP